MSRNELLSQYEHEITEEPIPIIDGYIANVWKLYKSNNFSDNDLKRFLVRKKIITLKNGKPVLTEMGEIATSLGDL